jgi:tetratricopeptide (TPR) repeat protein
MKKFVLMIILSLLLFPTLSSGEDLYEEQLNRGIKNSEPYTYLLIEKAKIDSAQEVTVLKEALKFSPDLPTGYFELSEASFNFSPVGIFKSVDYLLRGIESYKRNFWWLFSLAGSLFSSLIFSLIISIIIIILIRLPFDVPLLSHNINEDKKIALFLMVLISALIGPLFFLGGLLIIVGLYMKKWDKISVYLYFVFLLFTPLIFNTAVMFLNASNSGELKAIVRVNESRGNRYALSVLRDKNGYTEQFSYALAMQKEGGYPEAIDAYNRLIAYAPSAKVYNNLANCYVAMNDMGTAEKLYRKAIEIRPLASTLYNLSVISREMLNYEKGDEYFLSAQKLDSDAVSSFQKIFSKNPNRFVVDERLPSSNLWEYASAKTNSAYAVNLPAVLQTVMFIAAVSMIIIFYLLNRRFKHKAYRCKRCGTILCSKCEKRILWGRMCVNCYRSLVKLDELDAKERLARLLTVYDYQKKRRDIIKIISLILPGSGQVYAGNILYGLLFLWPFLFFLFIPVANTIFVPEISYFSHSWLSLCSLFLLSVVYIISNIITRRRLVRGWL